jgi:hypothetical protein
MTSQLRNYFQKVIRGDKMKDKKKIRLLYVTNDYIAEVIAELTKRAFEAHKIGTDGVYVYYYASEEVDLLRYVASQVEIKKIEDLGDVSLLQLDKIKDKISNVFRRYRIEDEEKPEQK